MYTHSKKTHGWNMKYVFYRFFGAKGEQQSDNLYIHSWGLHGMLVGFSGCVYLDLTRVIFYFVPWSSKPTIWEDILNFFQIFSKHQTINMPPCFEKVNWHGDLSKFPTWGRHHSLSHIQWTKIIKRSPQGGTRPKLWGSVLIKEG